MKISLNKNQNLSKTLIEVCSSRKPKSIKSYFFEDYEDEKKENASFYSDCFNIPEN